MPISTPPYIPMYGDGAPSIPASDGTIYFDQSVTPYGFYVRKGGAWNVVVPGGTGVDATALQGTPISATTPTANQLLQFDGTDWSPATISTGFPTVGKVETVTPGATGSYQMPDDTNWYLALGTGSKTSATFVLPQNPTEGQIVIMMSQVAITTSTYSAGSGATITWGGGALTNTTLSDIIIFVFHSTVWYARVSSS